MRNLTRSTFMAWSPDRDDGGFRIGGALAVVRCRPDACARGRGEGQRPRASNSAAAATVVLLFAWPDGRGLTGRIGGVAWSTTARAW
ncbi:hypothetical protein NS220_12960 [Microbacterium testaceum]|uniref:Uncharacterized protein n=1 Tax=Microbacterium testaceum TaxID=2033 RepID=A0A147EVD2_MICTE|nr:hypothetical protein NS220_12960 [Microbacterium testaceum]